MKSAPEMIMNIPAIWSGSSAAPMPVRKNTIPDEDIPICPATIPFDRSWM